MPISNSSLFAIQTLVSADFRWFLTNNRKNNNNHRKSQNECQTFPIKRNKTDFRSEKKSAHHGHLNRQPIVRCQSLLSHENLVYNWNGLHFSFLMSDPGMSGESNRGKTFTRCHCMRAQMEFNKVCNSSAQNQITFLQCLRKKLGNDVCVFAILIQRRTRSQFEWMVSSPEKSIRQKCFVSFSFHQELSAANFVEKRNNCLLKGGNIEFFKLNYYQHKRNM